MCDQKNAKVGRPAPVVFSQLEYQVLQNYIEDMRPKLLRTPSNIVFPPRSCYEDGKTLAFSSIYSILNKLKTKSGKTVSSRSLRGSKISENRRRRVPIEQQRSLAAAMSHTFETAERSYDYSSISDKVCDVLNSTTPVLIEPVPGPSGQHLLDLSSTRSEHGISMDTTLDVEDADLSIDTSTPLKRVRSADNEEKSAKKRFVYSSASSSSDLEETIKLLRTRKIISNKKSRSFPISSSQRSVHA